MKILIIRRDNIGDLILTTPLIASLAEQLGHPVDLLVNSYNRSVLENNPNVGKVWLYSKLHHCPQGTRRSTLIWQRLKSYWGIRREKYDVAIIAREHWDKRPLQWAKIAGAKRIIAFGDQGPSTITDLIPLPKQRCHIVELLSQLLKPLKLAEALGPLELYLSEQELTQARQITPLQADLPRFGLQISARKLAQQWPASHFIELAQRLSAQYQCQILLFWSPGSANNPLHPGDDEKAQQIVDACPDLPLTPVPTSNLRELMAAMSGCDQIVTSDGGALHVAAAVKVPIVAMFGNSNSHFWGPWGVDHEILDAPNQQVSQLTVDQVGMAFDRLYLRQRTNDNHQTNVVSSVTSDPAATGIPLGKNSQ